MELPKGTDNSPRNYFVAVAKKIIIITSGEAKEKEKATGIIFAKQPLSSSKVNPFKLSITQVHRSTARKWLFGLTWGSDGRQ